MAVRREQLLNAATTTVNEALDASETIITVTDGSVFPADGDYRLIIDSEVVLVTSRVTNDLTVVRGLDGTLAVTHSNGVVIDTIVTASSFDQFLNDCSAGGLFRPARRLMDKDGVILTKSDFSTIGMGSTVITDEADGTITLFIDQSTGGFKIMLRSIPSTPFKVRAKLELGAGANWRTAGTIIGLVARESSTGKFVNVYYEYGENCQPAKYNSETSFNSFYVSSKLTEADCPYVWLEMEDNGTTIFFRYSSDGVNFFELHSVSRTDFLAGGPNQFGWHVSAGGGNSQDHAHRLASWEEIDLA